MKTKLLVRVRTFTFLLLLQALSGCYISYVPTQQNVPLFKAKGEFEVTGLVAATDGNYLYYESFDPPKYNIIPEVQVAYAASDFVSVVAGGGKSFGDNTGFFAEAGGGLYKPFRFSDPKETYVIGILGVAGYGKAFPETDYFCTPNNPAELRKGPHWVRSYIQPYLGIREKDAEVAFSGRFTTFHEFMPEVDYYQNSRVYFFAEPAVTARLGFRNFKLQGQVAMAFELYSNDINGYPPLSISAGITYRLPSKK